MERLGVCERLAVSDWDGETDCEWEPVSDTVWESVGACDRERDWVEDGVAARDCVRVCVVESVWVALGD